MALSSRLIAQHLSECLPELLPLGAKQGTSIQSISEFEAVYADRSLWPSVFSQVDIAYAMSKRKPRQGTEILAARLAFFKALAEALNINYEQLRPYTTHIAVQHEQLGGRSRLQFSPALSEILGVSAQQVAFSLSHSGDIALTTVLIRPLGARWRIGIDIQSVPDFAREWSMHPLRRTIFSDAVLEAAAADPETELESLAAYFSALEAFAKASTLGWDGIRHVATEFEYQHAGLQVQLLRPERLSQVAPPSMPLLMLHNQQMAAAAVFYDAGP